MTLNAQALPVVSGQLDMPRFASAITERYDRFRSFRFGLPETGKVWKELEMALPVGYNAGM